MRKEYLDVADQIELLERRGVACDGNTGRTLLREGYYAVVNGYGKPFLDMTATRSAGEDRYVQGTTFDHMYALFSFDRMLRLLSFRELLRVEGMLRAVAASSFLEAHPTPDAYLDERCYTSARHYLLGEASYERNLRHTISTLSRYANEHEHDERGRDDARLAHYRNNYDDVPLWVVFSDFSYGNLYHFIALMRRDEQVAVCRRIAQALADDAPRQELVRRTLVEDVSLQVEVRNICAHNERLYDARMGERDSLGYARFVRMMARYLPADEAGAYADALVDLLDTYAGICPTVDRELAQTHMRDAALALRRR